MDVKAKVFLFAGDKADRRDSALDDLKKKIFPSGKGCSIFTYHCYDLNLNTLQEEIFTFSFDREKLSIFKGIEELDKEARNFLKDNLEKIAAVSHLIFESDYDVNGLRAGKNDFFDLLLREATLINLSSGVHSLTVEDFMLCLRKNDLSGALYTVNRLFDEEGDLSSLIIGILNGRAAYIENKAEKARVLDLLWHADRGIKEKSADSRLAVETLLIKILTPLGQ
jgi:hypothetical protein